MITPAEARERLVAIAKSQVGVREVGGNNKGSAIVMYQKSTWLTPGPWAWCAAFICWAIEQWLKDVEVKELLGFKSNLAAENWRPQTAGAFDFERWAKSKGLKVLGEQDAVQAGDLVIYDFSHIGFVSAVAVAKSKTILTIEGNTNGKGERDSVSGDGVWSKERDRKLAKVFIRLV